MKTTILKALIIAQAVMLIGNVSYAGNSGGKADVDTSKHKIVNSKCLEVTVKSTENDKALKGTTVKLYWENEPVSIINADITSLQKIVLDRNKHYTIEVSKEGYYSKLVSISTFLPLNVEKDMDYLYEYFLQMDLMKKKPGTDPYYTDFPIALISYKKAEDKFNFSHKYTRGIVNKLKKELGRDFASSYKYE